MRGRSLVNMSAIWCLDGTWRTRAGLTMYYLFPNKMYVHLNMLGALMLHMITWEINGTDIVTIHQSGLRDRKVELQEKVTYPARFKDHVLPFPLYSASALERERERESRLMQMHWKQIREDGRNRCSGAKRNTIRELRLKQRRGGAVLIMSKYFILSNIH
jgi:hypothetical protein